MFRILLKVRNRKRPTGLQGIPFQGGKLRTELTALGLKLARIRNGPLGIGQEDRSAVGASGLYGLDVDHLQEVFQRPRGTQLATHTGNGCELIDTTPQAVVGFPGDRDPVNGIGDKSAGAAEQLDVLVREEVGTTASKLQFSDGSST